MNNYDELRVIWTNVSVFLNQNDLTVLARTNKWFSLNIALPKLYENIVICRDPVLRTDTWNLDTNRTYVSGYRSVKKSDDQNDLFLYERIQRLSQSLHLAKVKTLVVQEDLFTDTCSGQKVLQCLVDKLIEIDTIENMDIRDKQLFDKNYEKLLQLSNLNFVRVNDIENLNLLQSIKTLESVELTLTLPEFSSNCLNSEVKEQLFPRLKCLVINDVECSSLRAFQFFNTSNIVFKSIKALKFNHVHSIHDYNKTFRELTTSFLKDVIPLNQLVKLELEISCGEPDCHCVDNFLMEMAPSLTSLKELGLIERTFVSIGNHDVEEKWDLTINKFILHLPNVETNLQKLSIRHCVPLNGLAQDCLEGNYIRRRTLYENVLPKLKSLEILIAPTMLQSLSSYEILVCDLLWNGCECSFCAKFLGIFDKFLMNHQYYSHSEGLYKDIIPTVFFAYAGNALSHRYLTETDWDIRSLSIAPISLIWNLHGYENINHFHDYICLFDESAYPSLCTIISHFFNSYMDYLVKSLPKLRTCILSGIYYMVTERGQYISVYD